jgi:hypothetical protein
MNPQIAKLEALLTRIKANAAAPRVAHAAHVEAAHPPAAEVHEPEPGTLESPRHEPQPSPLPPAREVEVPLESRARLVAAPQVEAEELEADEVLELDDRHVVREEPSIDVDVAIAAPTPEPMVVEEAKTDEHDEAPPPSSRRPIAEPAETPQEAQIEVQRSAPLTPPPESGKQVAVEALTFDDDLTGVREAQPSRPQTPPPQEPSIQLQSIRGMPAVKQPAPLDEMEVELPGTSPPPGPLPEMRSPRIESAEAAPGPIAAEITRPTRPVASDEVAHMVGTVKPASPKTFGELLDAALSL